MKKYKFLKKLHGLLSRHTVRSNHQVSVSLRASPQTGVAIRNFLKDFAANNTLSVTASPCHLSQWERVRGTDSHGLRPRNDEEERWLVAATETFVILSGGEAGVEESTHYRSAEQTFGAKILRLAALAQDDRGLYGSAVEKSVEALSVSPLGCHRF